MDKKQPTKISLFLSIAICLIINGCQSPQSKPNVIIIFTDDQGYADVGVYGAEGFQTPNLDGLAADGIKFTDFYVAATVCTPSRAALLTGSYPKRVGLHEAVLFPYSEKGLSPDELIIPEVLKEKGYTSACVGKWHLGHKEKFMPYNQGFDHYYGVPYSNDMDNHFYQHNNFQSPPLPLIVNGKEIESGPDQRYLTRKYTEESIRFIREQKDKPFFLYLAHNMPHLPLHVSEKFDGVSEYGLYGDVISEIDWSVGEIVQALKEEGLYDNTIIIFTSDNGPVTWTKAGNAKPLRGSKGTTWEGGQRVPAIVTWPKNIQKGQVINQVVTAMDILPTVADITGAKLPTDLKIDGSSIKNLLMDPNKYTSSERPLYYYARNGNLEAVRLGKWKLHSLKSNGWNEAEQGEFTVSLYDLENDISETQNLADNHPEVVERLKKMMEDFDNQLTKEARPVGTWIQSN
ncbi:sulfatase [Fulvivirgaceae bacterium BMA10]|uniref:Sulfatase n=1 Tax=Splendidivirga corallicola TaxID=3051826 RepID=A0ABT8L1A2_9BACT|nr:sulfatase [Fulvivirgaceae bacterium BMA10]